MNRINRLFQNNPENVLSVYFTAGYPALNSTAEIIQSLSLAGVDMIEIGIPFSDPLADGPVIQSSSAQALKNGMSLKLLFDQLKFIRKKTGIPLLLMGYLNPVLQFGMENFCTYCAETGIDGVILPDLPVDVYEKEYITVFEEKGLHHIFLLSPQTKPERIRKIDNLSRGFIYMVSSSSTTGVKTSFSPEQVEYFGRIHAMMLKNPTLIGFGISNTDSFKTACRYSSGAIIGSAFVNMLGERGYSETEIRRFVQEIRG
jgi:tryptophan synthase alpha chain